MKLLSEITKAKEKEVTGPVVPPDGWSVGHLANHGLLLSCEGFTLRLDLDQLNALFDLAESGESGEVTDHNGHLVLVEIGDDSIVLTREGDKTYPQGVVLDSETLKEMGIEQEEQPEGDVEEEPEGDTMPGKGVSEGLKRAFRRVGKKIKRGFRVTSGFRKGRVVSSAKAAFKPRAPAKTRMKLRIAAKRKKVIRILKGKITRRKAVSKRLRALNKRVK